MIMFKSILREISWNRSCFIVTIIARSLRNNGGEIALTIPRNVCIRNFSSQSHKIVKARKYVVVNHFVNEAKPTDLKLVEEELSPLQNGEYLAEAEYFSVDPYMRPYVRRYPLGITMLGTQIAKIVESKNPAFPIGKKIVGNMGWRTHTIVNPKFKDRVFQEHPYLLPDIGDLPSSLFGGNISSAVIYQMKPFGRVAVCGSISSYNTDRSSLPKCTILQPILSKHELRMEGFLVTRWMDRWNEGIMQNLQWLREGKLHYRETVTKGFENMFEAFIGMLRGENIGKAIVQA
ncbi:PTGR1 reductase, partial [Acromyrmex insinuator]